MAMMRIQILRLLVIALILGSNAAVHATANEDAAITLRDNGRLAYRHGRYEEAIEYWQQALAALKQKPPNHVMIEGTSLPINLLLSLAIAAQRLGAHEWVDQWLLEALALARQIEAAPGIEVPEAVATQISRVFIQSGDWALAKGHWDRAGEYLGEGISRARALPHTATLARALNHLGKAWSLADANDKALATYSESLELAQSNGDTALTNQLRLNMIRSHLRLSKEDSGDHRQSAYNHFLQAAASLLQQPDPAVTVAGDLIALALLGQQLRQSAVAMPDSAATMPVIIVNPPGWQPEAQTAKGQPGKNASIPIDQLNTWRKRLLQRALEIATTFRDDHYRAYAHGYLGQLDEIGGAYQQARQQTENARWFAEQAADPASLYLWQWQLGRLYRAQGQIDAAIEAYRQAVATLDPIRGELMDNHRHNPATFHERIRPIYFDLADLLLTQAAQLAAGTATTDNNAVARLQEARNTVERLKTAELQDYFQDQCTVASQAKETALESIDPHSAVIYPIMLPQRLVLLISIQGKLTQVVAPVTAMELEQSARRFRRHLQIRSQNSYLRESRQLYDWLIRPLHAHLQRAAVDTLVFVPDGVLRTIPFATLQDKENQEFLIQRYAVAMTPGLSLTDPQPLWRDSDNGIDNSDVLLVGLSEGVQNFSPLPSVPRELRAVQSLIGGDILQDREYSDETLGKALKENSYSVLHLATHGVFGGSDERSFLLTYDGSINMRELGELLQAGISREQPLELLTLSACQTALGDERSGLGLAGIAVQSGARSANASLWFVDDEATAELMTAFYRQLAEGRKSKAQALQYAQLSLMQQARYRHPIYWGAYLIIGNWL